MAHGKSDMVYLHFFVLNNRISWEIFYRWLFEYYEEKKYMHTKRSTESKCQRVPYRDIVFLLVFENSFDYETDGKSCQVCPGSIG